MNSSRTTLSFLDLALMLLSAFAYTHFVNIADSETRQKMAKAGGPVEEILGSYDYAAPDFFGDSNAMLTDFAKKEIVEILTMQPKQMLIIEVAAAPEAQNGSRLRQWETVSARSAAIADAFEKVGQNGRMIVLKVPEKLVSKPGQKQSVKLTFLPLETK
ncbi:hypothetical protein [Parasphingorhabdus halotolerans]|uniref:Uncharacterized protein n=1 Tax=Parasphingorhabdus halotolerans TaxID=2725558 RepID=A0A6H2DIJ2_9SPHN|nr:hypothetical protein [Parasphingorhabdus halotolerans]QJB68008.1 hypothetical protein HF685_00710 [Parasphingorhabdus halotolerans]